MIYQFFKILLRFTIRSYFRRVKIEGKENIPKKGPFIFVANHPSAFMDPIIIGTIIKPTVHFLVAGEYVGKGVFAWMFKTFFHAIPVYRPHTRPDEIHKNKDMFKACYQHLGKGGSLLVFPEGLSLTENKIQPLKTGVARIARGAELMNNKKLGLTLIPIGLNYSNPHQFRSDLFVNIGEPIMVKDYISEDDDNNIKESREITALMEDKLKELVLHIQTETDATMLSKLDLVYSKELKKELGFSNKEQDREFNMHKDMIHAIEYFKEHKKEDFKRIELAIDDYLKSLSDNGLDAKYTEEIKKQKPLKRRAMLFFGFPFFLIGYINNILPYYLVRVIVNKIKVKSSFVGSIILAVGLFSFLFWYILVSILLVTYTPLHYYALFYPVVMYFTGIFALIYSSLFSFSLEKKKLKKVRQKNKKIYNQLRLQREELISMLNKYKREFESIND